MVASSVCRTRLSKSLKVERLWIIESPVGKDGITNGGNPDRRALLYDVSDRHHQDGRDAA